MIGIDASTVVAKVSYLKSWRDALSVRTFPRETMSVSGFSVTGCFPVSVSS